MTKQITQLSFQEKQWLLETRITRLTDNKEAQIYPMGAERYLQSVLLGHKTARYALNKDIVGKKVLLIPGHGNSGFLLALAGCRSVTIIDKDPVTVAWIKAFKKYYHYKSNKGPSIGELMQALTAWYPPLLRAHWRHVLSWLFQINALRQRYIYSMMELVKQALRAKHQDAYELNKTIYFYVGDLSSFKQTTTKRFDTAWVPYLLGVKNGIETEQGIVSFVKQLFELVPKGPIIVTPSRKQKEFYLSGKCYLESLSHSSIQSIPSLEQYSILEDKHWFRTQGLMVIR